MIWTSNMQHVTKAGLKCKPTMTQANDLSGQNSLFTLDVIDRRCLSLQIMTFRAKCVDSHSLLEMPLMKVLV